MKPRSRWYTEPMVWLVLAIPVLTLIAGLVTFGLSRVAADDGDPNRMPPARKQSSSVGVRS